MHKMQNDFLSGKLKLNPRLVNRLQTRMPRYRYARFADACDVTNTFSMVDDAEPILNDQIDDFTLDDVDNLQDPRDVSFGRMILSAMKRFHRFVPVPDHSDLRRCTPWLSKERPESVEISTKRRFEGNIYVGVVTTHTSHDDFVAVQELGGGFGFLPPVFGAKATVAFPPICKGEVWTVGWVQAVTKASKVVACENDFVSVACFKILYTFFCL